MPLAPCTLLGGHWCPCICSGLGGAAIVKGAGVCTPPRWGCSAHSPLPTATRHPLLIPQGRWFQGQQGGPAWHCAQPGSWAPKHSSHAWLPTKPGHEASRHLPSGGQILTGRVSTAWPSEKATEDKPVPGLFMQRFKMGPVTGSRIWRHEPMDETVNPECTTESLAGEQEG